MSRSRQRTTAGRPDRASCLARIRSVRKYGGFVLATLIAVVSLPLVVAVLLLTGCSSESAKRGDGTVPEAAGTTDAKDMQKDAGSGIADTTSLPPPRPLSAAPRRILVSCKRSRLLRPACPRRLPAVDRYTSSLCPTGKRGCLFRERIDMFNVESPRSPHPKTRRPRFIHLVLYAGDLGGPKGFQTHAPSAFPFDWPDPSPARPLIDGLSPHRGMEALAFGRRRFGDVEGELVLAPAMQAMDGDHLIFRWRSCQREYAVSLHAWKPLTETAATLRAIVAAVPAARR